MDEERERSPRDEQLERAGRESGLFSLLRRVVGPRPPLIIVMEPDGRICRSSQRPADPK